MKTVTRFQGQVHYSATRNFDGDTDVPMLVTPTVIKVQYEAVHVGGKERWFYIGESCVIEVATGTNFETEEAARRSIKELAAYRNRDYLSTYNAEINKLEQKLANLKKSTRNPRSCDRTTKGNTVSGLQISNGIYVTFEKAQPKEVIWEPEVTQYAELEELRKKAESNLRACGFNIKLSKPQFDTNDEAYNDLISVCLPDETSEDDEISNQYRARKRARHDERTNKSDQATQRENTISTKQSIA